MCLLPHNQHITYNFDWFLFDCVLSWIEAFTLNLSISLDPRQVHHIWYQSKFHLGLVLNPHIQTSFFPFSQTQIDTCSSLNKHKHEY